MFSNRQNDLYDFLQSLGVFAVTQRQNIWLNNLRDILKVEI